MFLLDVNVLLAFAYQRQVCHSRVRRWVRHVDQQHSEDLKFATCSIVELGFIRIASGKSKLAPEFVLCAV
jgi:predicted nucleic acid-binding protein